MSTNGLPSLSALPSLPAAASPGGAAPPPAFDAGPTVDLTVGGMHCASCVARIEKALQAVPGVSVAAVDLVSGRAHVRLKAPGSSGALPPPEALVAAVKDAGYDAAIVAAGAEPAAEADAEQAERAARLADLRGRLAVALAVALPVAALSMLDVTFPGRNGLFLVLTAVVLGYSGRDFFVSGLSAALRGAPDMNSLVALGTGTAFLTSAAATVAPALFAAHGAHAPVYYEAAVVVVALVLLGRFLEERAKGKAGEAIRRLASLGARTARVVRGGAETEVPAERVAKGDLLRVLPGERVPADGVLVEGTTSVDESLVTGESLPVDKAPGDPLLGGTLNGEAAVLVRATRVGRETALAQVIRLVRDAQAAKAPIQRLADRIASVFVPVVVAIAIASFAAWFFLGPEPHLLRALVAATAVLLIACPCALGLATPIALLVGTGRGAQMGLLVRNAEVLEKAEGITDVVFDKTGTLTVGRPRVTGVHPSAGTSEGELLAVLAAVESGSEHPLARAVLAAAEERSVAAPRAAGVRAVPGGGVTGTVDGVEVVAGSEAFLRSRGIGTPAELLSKSDGGTLVLAARGGALLGALTVTDPVKPGAREALRDLAARGLRLHLLSGDRKAAVDAVAREVGLPEENVIAGLTPAEKVARVRALHAGGARVAMVGDGLNDAPALAAADLGIAIGTATDVARAASDVTLVGGALSGVGTALSLAKATLTNIRQNLFLAFVYNVVLIPVAAGVLYPFTGWTLNPMLAGGAMALSSLSVVTNALRLRRFGSAPRARPARP